MLPDSQPANGSTGPLHNAQSASGFTGPLHNGQLIQRGNVTYKTIQEGQAFILVPPNTQLEVDPKQAGTVDEAFKEQHVFYNPIQNFNRDLSVLAIKAFGEDWLARREIEASKGKLSKQQRSRKRKLKEIQAGPGQEARPLENVDLAEQPSLGAGALATDTVEGVSAEKRLKTQSSETSDVPQSELDQPRAEDAAAVPGAENTQPDARPHRPQFRILDALSATGLRALRYAKELPFVTSVVANDSSREAIKMMGLNVEANGLTDAIIPNLGDANAHMYSVAYPPTDSHGPSHVNKRYQVIDLDPYGTAAPFIDAALQSLVDGGLLCVTCTDSAVFASTNYSEKTFALYGGLPARGPYCHEVGLRLIINGIAATAAKYGRTIEPLLSLSIDFYIRIFIRVKHSPASVKFLASKTMVAHACDTGCGAWSTQPLGRTTKTNHPDNKTFKYHIAQGPTTTPECEHCGSKTHVMGPMWGGPLHNAAFIEKILSDVETVDPAVYTTTPRVLGMLHTALEEVLVSDRVTELSAKENSGNASNGDQAVSLQPLIDYVPPHVLDQAPFFFDTSLVCRTVHAQSPPYAVIHGALRGLGYRTARSHCHRGSIKTNAPWDVIWEVIREWVRQKSPVKPTANKEGSPGWNILQKTRPTPNAEVEHEAVVDLKSPRPKRDEGDVYDEIVPLGLAETSDEVVKNALEDILHADSESRDPEIGPPPVAHSDKTLQVVSNDQMTPTLEDRSTAPNPDPSLVTGLTAMIAAAAKQGSTDLDAAQLAARIARAFGHPRGGQSLYGWTSKKSTGRRNSSVLREQSNQRLLAVNRLNVVFDGKLSDREPVDKKLVRYQMNPRANWGPMVRAKGKAQS